MGAERAYVTMDRWESLTAYDEFREKFAAEDEELDSKNSFRNRDSR